MLPRTRLRDAVLWRQVAQAGLYAILEVVQERFRHPAGRDVSVERRLQADAFPTLDMNADKDFAGLPILSTFWRCCGGEMPAGWGTNWALEIARHAQYWIGQGPTRLLRRLHCYR